MCIYINLITETIEDKIKAKESFTAYEITFIVRTKTTEKVYHNEVRKEINKLFLGNKMGDYTRKLGNFSNLVHQPWVYQPKNTSNSKERFCISAKNCLEAGFSKGDYVYIFSDNGKLVIENQTTGNHLLKYKVDKYRNIRIPKKVLNKLGFLNFLSIKNEVNKITLI